MSQSPPNLSRTMARGMSVTIASYLLSRLINFGTTVALARLLSPADMGLVATALLVVYVVDVVRDFGLREAIVFHGSERDDMQATAFYLMLGMSFFQASAVGGFSAILWARGEQAGLVELLGILALSFPLQALGGIPEAVLQRSLRFSELAVAEICGVLAKAAVTIFALIFDVGPASFAIGQLAGTGLRTLLLWLRPRIAGFLRFPFNASHVGSLIGYGKHIFGTGLIYIFRTRSDQAAIALLIGDVALAGYFLASRLPEILISGVSTAVTRVVFPSFVEAGRAGKGLAEIFLSTLHGYMALIAPIAVGLAVISGNLMPLLFGGAYADAARAMAFLAMIGLPLTIGWSIGDVLKATGRPELLSRYSLLEAGVIVPIVWTTALISEDLVLVSAALFCGECITSLIWLSLAPRLVGVSPRRALTAAARPVLAALLMGATVLIVRAFLGPSDLVAVAVSMAVGAVVYAMLLAFFDPEAVRKVRTALGALERQ